MMRYLNGDWPMLQQIAVIRVDGGVAKLVLISQGYMD